jgi:hypothetical protein
MLFLLFGSACFLLPDLGDWVGDTGMIDDTGAGGGTDTAITDTSSTDTGGTDTSSDDTGGKDSGGKDTSGSGATDTSVGGDTPKECVGAPDLTWDNFGEGFLMENCQGCHASANVGSARHGAPTDMYFDTVEDAWERKDAILYMATGEDPAMPPSGGPSDDDRMRLFWWLTCGTSGT